MSMNKNKTNNPSQGKTHVPTLSPRSESINDSEMMETNQISTILSSPDDISSSSSLGELDMGVEMTLLSPISLVTSNSIENGVGTLKTTPLTNSQGLSQPDPLTIVPIPVPTEATPMELSSLKLAHLLDIDEKPKLTIKTENFTHNISPTPSPKTAVEEAVFSTPESLFGDYLSNDEFDLKNLPKAETKNGKTSGLFYDIQIIEENLDYRPYSWLCLDNNNSLRNACKNIVTREWYYVMYILITISYTIFLGFSVTYVNVSVENSVPAAIHWIFIALFIIDFFLKSIAKGMVGKNSHLADVWSSIDFIATVCGICYQLTYLDGFGATAIFRFVGVMRYVPHLHLLMTAIGATLFNIYDVLVFFFFVCLFFSLIGVQSFYGILKRRCYTGDINNNPVWEEDMLCRLDRHCAREIAGGKCGIFGENPNKGLTSYDNVALGFVTNIIIMSLEGWSEVMYDYTKASYGRSQVMFLVLMVVGGLFTMQLVTAVVFTRFQQKKRDCIKYQENLLLRIAYRQKLEKVGKMDLLMKDLLDLYTQIHKDDHLQDEDYNDSYDQRQSQKPSNYQGSSKNTTNLAENDSDSESDNGISSFYSSPGNQESDSTLINRVNMKSNTQPRHIPEEHSLKRQNTMLFSYKNQIEKEKEAQMFDNQQHQVDELVKKTGKQVADPEILKRYNLLTGTRSIGLQNLNENQNEKENPKSHLHEYLDRYNEPFDYDVDPDDLHPLSAPPVPPHTPVSRDSLSVNNLTASTSSPATGRLPPRSSLPSTSPSSHNTVTPTSTFTTPSPSNGIRTGPRNGGNSSGNGISNGTSNPSSPKVSRMPTIQPLTNSPSNGVPGQSPPIPGRKSFFQNPNSNSNTNTNLSLNTTTITTPTASQAPAIPRRRSHLQTTGNNANSSLPATPTDSSATSHCRSTVLNTGDKNSVPVNPNEAPAIPRRRSFLNSNNNNTNTATLSNTGENNTNNRGNNSNMGDSSINSKTLSLPPLTISNSDYSPQLASPTPTATASVSSPSPNPNKPLLSSQLPSSPQPATPSLSTSPNNPSALSHTQPPSPNSKNVSKNMVKKKSKSTYFINPYSKITKSLDNVKYPTLLALISHRYFHWLICFCVIVNTIVLCTDHSDMSNNWYSINSYVNFAFSVVFLIEFLLTMVAFYPQWKAYLKDPFNWIDGFVVFVAIMEVILFIVVDRTNIWYRTFRSARIIKLLKLLKYLTQTRSTLHRVIASVKDLFYFLLLILVFVCIFSISGTYLFKNEMECDDEGGITQCRANFDHIGYGMFSIFQLFTSENFNDVLLDATNGTDYWAVVFIVIVWFLGNLVLLSIFISILVDLIDADDDDEEENESGTSENDDNTVEHSKTQSKHSSHPLTITSKKMDALSEEAEDDNEETNTQHRSLSQMNSTNTNTNTNTNSHPLAAAPSVPTPQLSIRSLSMSTPKNSSNPKSSSNPSTHLHFTFSNMSQDNADSNTSAEFIPKHSTHAKTVFLEQQAWLRSFEESIETVNHLSTIALSYYNNTPKYDYYHKLAENTAIDALLLRLEWTSLSDKWLVLPEEEEEEDEDNQLSACTEFFRQILPSFILNSWRSYKTHYCEGGSYLDSDKKFRDITDTGVPVALIFNNILNAHDGAGNSKYRSPPIYGYSLFFFSHKNWFRRIVYRFTESPLFVLFYLISTCLIFAMTALTADLFTSNFRTETVFTQRIDIFISCYLIIEVALYLITQGFMFQKNAYMYDWANIIDLGVCITSAIYSFKYIDHPNVAEYTYLRGARALRLLRLLTVNYHINLIVISIIGAMKALGKVIFIPLITLLVFASAGVQLFGGSINQCNSITDSGEVELLFNVDKADCELLMKNDILRYDDHVSVENSKFSNLFDIMHKNNEVISLDITNNTTPTNFIFETNINTNTNTNTNTNSHFSPLITKEKLPEFVHYWGPPPAFNFNNMANAILTLFEMFTFESWPHVFALISDSSGPDRGPIRNHHIKTATLYCLLWLVFGSFIISSFVTGVIVEEYKNEMERRLNSNKKLSGTQQQYLQTLRLITRIGLGQYSIPPRCRSTINSDQSDVSTRAFTSLLVRMHRGQICRKEFKYFWEKCVGKYLPNDEFENTTYIAKFNSVVQPALETSQPALTRSSDTISNTNNNGANSNDLTIENTDTSDSNKSLENIRILPDPPLTPLPLSTVDPTSPNNASNMPLIPHNTSTGALTGDDSFFNLNSVPDLQIPDTNTNTNTNGYSENYFKEWKKLSPYAWTRIRQNIFYPLSQSIYFHYFMYFFLVIDIIILCLRWEGMGESLIHKFNIFHLSISSVFLFEIFVKNTGLGFNQYLNSYHVNNLGMGVWWFRLDVFVTLFTTIGYIWQVSGGDTPAIITLFSVIQSLRIFRIVRQMKMTQSIIQTVTYTIPTLASGFSVLVIIVLGYSIFGMHLFGQVRRYEYLNEFVNFSDFWVSIRSLLTMMTGESWPNVMNDLMFDDERVCGKYSCGGKLSGALYIVSFVIATTFIIINVFVAIVIDNFEFETELVEIDRVLPVNTSDYKKFQEAWISWTKQYIGAMWRQKDKKAITKIMQKIISRTSIKGKDKLHPGLIDQVFKMGYPSDYDENSNLLPIEFDFTTNLNPDSRVNIMSKMRAFNEAKYTGVGDFLNRLRVFNLAQDVGWMPITMLQSFLNSAPAPLGFVGNPLSNEQFLNLLSNLPIKHYCQYVHFAEVSIALIQLRYGYETVNEISPFNETLKSCLNTLKSTHISYNRVKNICSHIRKKLDDHILPPEKLSELTREERQTYESHLSSNLWRIGYHGSAIEYFTGPTDSNHDTSAQSTQNQSTLEDNSVLTV